jgi:hypothetical protein
MKKVTPVDEWQKAVLDHIKLLNDEERFEFAHKIIFDIANEVGRNGYEIIGLLETVKLNLLEYLNTPECDEDCDKCNGNKE